MVSIFRPEETRSCLRGQKKAKQPHRVTTGFREYSSYPLYKNVSIQSLHKKVLTAAAMQYKEPPNHLSGKNYRHRVRAEPPRTQPEDTDALESRDAGLALQR